MRFIKWFLLLFIIWIGLTLSLDWQELLVGGLASAFISIIVSIMFSKGKGEKTSFNLISILKYIPIFVKNLVIANIDVALIVLNPKLPINPGIVEIKTDKETSFKKFVIANSITLTPGTLTLDIVNNKMYVHWINVSTKDTEEAAKIIKGDFERAMK
jgi:multicomponent Na+:H+ antiporter subunit E